MKIEVSEKEIANAVILRKKSLIPSRPTALFEGSRERLEKTESSVIGGMEKKSTVGSVSKKRELNIRDLKIYDGDFSENVTSKYHFALS